MPSLPAPMQEQADEAASQGGSFLLEPGVYTARLADVKSTTAAGSGNPMWALEFDTVRKLDGAKCAGRQWTNLVLIDSVMWKVGQFFAAFGVPSSVNTDELINHRIRLQVGKRVIQQGARAGQEGNEVNGFTALAADDDGYAENRKLASRFGGGTAAAAAAPATAKKAPAKSAPAKAADEPAAPPADDPWGDDAGGAGEVDF